MKKQLLLSIICAASALTASAQTALTLSDCRRLAVENNAKVRIAEDGRRAATEVSREAFTKYFPQVNASWMGYRSNKGAIQYTLPSVGQLVPEAGSIIGGALPPELAGQVAPLLSKSLGEIELIKKGWSAGITAIQPVFMGGQIVNGNRLAHVGEAVADLRKEEAIDDVILTAEQYYWQIVTLQSKKQTLQSVMQMVDTLEYQVGVAVSAGVILPNDQLKVQLRQGELRAMMVDLDNGIALASSLLAQYVGLSGDSITIVSEPVPDDVPPYPLDIYMEPGQALPSTVDYRLLDQNVKASDLRARIAVGENLPQVGIGAGWIYDDLFSQRHNFAAVMLTVNVPISDWWGGSHKIKKARIEAESARIQQEDLSQMLEIGMSSAWDDLTAAHRKMSIAHRSIAQAKENLRLNRNYYDAGVATITDLLDAQTLYRQSLDGYTEAYGAFRQSRARYLDATGRTTDQGNFEF